MLQLLTLLSDFLVPFIQTLQNSLMLMLKILIFLVESMELVLSLTHLIVELVHSAAQYVVVPILYDLHHI